MSKKRKHPGNRVENDAPMFKRLEAELKASRRPRYTKPGEPIGRCAYCGRSLFYERSFHWMYDEDGQRVRKCNSERDCREVRIEHGHDESYRRAVLRFNRPGKGHWEDIWTKTNGNDG